MEWLNYDFENSDSAILFKERFQEIMRDDNEKPYDVIEALVCDEGYDDIDCMLMVAQIEIMVYGKVMHMDDVVCAIEDELNKTGDDSDKSNNRRNKLLKFKAYITSLSPHWKRKLKAIDLKNELDKQNENSLSKMRVVVKFEQKEDDHGSMKIIHPSAELEIKNMFVVENKVTIEVG